MPEAGFEPAHRCRYTPAKCTRLPVPPFGHVRENGEPEQTHPQVTSRSHGVTIALRVRKVIIVLFRSLTIPIRSSALNVNRTFLTAEWRQLIMLNYEVEPQLLAGLVPRGITLDTWSGRSYVSLVGFLFDRTRVLGMPVPFHRTFEEVNLRFYVARTVGGEVRRGVTFIKELVPRRLVAAIARYAYNEPYDAVAMRHRYGPVGNGDAPTSIEYGWQAGGTWSHMRVMPIGSGRVPVAGSEEEFITEHYWGYTRQCDGSTIEYRVSHPPWRVWPVAAAELTGNLAAVYGPAFGAVLSASPRSAFLADGSAVAVGWPTPLVKDA